MHSGITKPLTAACSSPIGRNIEFIRRQVKFGGRRCVFIVPRLRNSTDNAFRWQWAHDRRSDVRALLERIGGENNKTEIRTAHDAPWPSRTDPNHAGRHPTCRARHLALRTLGAEFGWSILSSEGLEEMVGLGRVELPTNGLGNRCSIHLSYRPMRHILTEAAPVAGSAIGVP
jgi:hypothetical protein